SRRTAEGMRPRPGPEGRETEERTGTRRRATSRMPLSAPWSRAVVHHHPSVVGEAVAKRGDDGPRCGVDGEPEHVGAVVVADRVEQSPCRPPRGEIQFGEQE